MNKLLTRTQMMTLHMFGEETRDNLDDLKTKCSVSGQALQLFMEISYQQARRYGFDGEMEDWMRFVQR